MFGNRDIRRIVKVEQTDSVSPELTWIGDHELFALLDTQVCADDNMSRAQLLVYLATSHKRVRDFWEHRTFGKNFALSLAPKFLHDDMNANPVYRPLDKMPFNYGILYYLYRHLEAGSNKSWYHRLLQILIPKERAVIFGTNNRLFRRYFANALLHFNASSYAFALRTAKVLECFCLNNFPDDDSVLKKVDIKESDLFKRPLSHADAIGNFAYNLETLTDKKPSLRYYIWMYYRDRSSVIEFSEVYKTNHIDPTMDHFREQILKVMNDDY